MLVLSNGELVTVEWVQHEILESPIKVYNFEVEDFHARIGEGIVTTVGSSTSHKDVLENPDLISQTVLNKGANEGVAQVK